jgi:microcystin degradation protein MlrC
MKAFTAGLGAETNTFSGLYTGLKDFQDCFLFAPYTHPSELTEVSAPLFVLREKRVRSGWEVVEGTYAFALPGGRVGREAYEILRERILSELRAALPIDMVALSMHGAMAAIGIDDCEGDLLRQVRQIVGPAVPVGAEIDPHAHLSDAMVENTDFIVAMREYPHTDFLERGRELIDLLERAVRGAVHPVSAVYDCHTIGRFHTMREPMRGFVDGMARLLAETPKLLSVSFVHGFPWGDVADMGAKMLVIADGDRALAERMARDLGWQIEHIRARTFTPPVSVAAGIDIALAATGKPVVLADIADNPGGGAAGDSTILLSALLARDVEGCLGPLWDPLAVHIATAAGIGATVPMRIGGKASLASGAPLDVEAEILAVNTNAFQSWAGTRMKLGAACAVRIGRMRVVLTSVRDQAYGPDLFSNLGVDPKSGPIVAVKSAQHFMAGFAPVAHQVVLVGGGGPLENDFRRIAYHNIRRPKWPLDPVPEN